MSDCPTCHDEHGRLAVTPGYGPDGYEACPDPWHAKPTARERIGTLSMITGEFTPTATDPRDAVSERIAADVGAGMYDIPPSPQPPRWTPRSSMTSPHRSSPHWKSPATSPWYPTTHPNGSPFPSPMSRRGWPAGAPRRSATSNRSRATCRGQICCGSPKRSPWNPMLEVHVMGETNSPQVPEMQRSGSDPLTEARQPTMVVTRSGNGTYVEWFDAEGHLKDNWAMHIDPTPDEMFTREMADEIERSHRLLAVLADQLEAADSRKRELEAAIAVHKVQKLRPQWVTGGGHDLALWALIEDEKAAPEAKVTDLMEALQQSVAAARAENRRAVAPEDEQKENGRG